MEPAPPPLDCPFVGLQPYAEEHREYFFGRGRERRIIAANLYAARLSVLYGASGVGKSSILRAGVAADLRQAPRTAVVYWHEWHDASFLGQLKQLCIDAVAAASGQAAAVDPAAPLDELVAALQRRFRGSILILLDQFEDYFLYHPEQETGHDFDAELARTINRGDLEASVLIALRDDWLARLDRFRARIPNLLGNTIRLAHLDTAAAEEAIRRPLAVWNDRHPGTGAGIEDGLVEAIIRDVRTGRASLSESAGLGEATGGRERNEIETAFLQLVLTKVWDAERQPGPFLRLATYEGLGRERQIVQAHVNALLDQLTADERESCARMFPHLVTPGGSKIAHTTSDLVAFSERPSEETMALLAKLTAQRVLRRIAQPERYEIFHDVLAPAILNWRLRHVEAKEQAQRVAEARKQEQRRRRKARWLLAGTSVVLALMALAARFVWQSRQLLPAPEITRVSDDPKSKPLPDVTPPGIALSLSGGGYRAMLFHVGVLWRLNELGYLSKLGRVSSVSGGSITAGVLAAGWSGLRFDARGVATNFNEQLVTPVLRMADTNVDVMAALIGFVPGLSASSSVEAAYRKHLFGHRTLQDLPDHPDFVFDATNQQSGVLWRFTKRYMADYRVGLIEHPRVELAVAVAASSAFPPVLSPVRLKLKDSDFVPHSGKDLQRPPFTTDVFLDDGGIYDNLGLEPVWKSYDTILVSDGGQPFSPDEEPDSDKLGQTLRVLNVIQSQVHALRTRSLVGDYKDGKRKGAYWGIATKIASYKVPGALPCPPEKTSLLAAYPTRLAAVPQAIQQRLINWGYAICDAAMRAFVDKTAPPPGGFPYPAQGVR